MRNVDCFCEECENTYEIICDPDTQPPCPRCTTPMIQQWWSRSKQQSTVWDKSEWATVFKKEGATGKDAYSFPAKADKPTPPGFERITIRSDKDMARIERDAGVRSERRWFDRGSGGYDPQHTPIHTPRRDTFSE